jgi:hypothetical protein
MIADTRGRLSVVQAAGRVVMAETATTGKASGTTRLDRHMIDRACAGIDDPAKMFAMSFRISGRPPARARHTRAGSQADCRPRSPEIGAW